jgi:ComF family protein
MGGPNVKNTMIDNMLEFVAPHLCCGCGKIGSLLCDHCKYDIITESLLGCVVCNQVNSDGICPKHLMTYKKAWLVGIRSGALQRLIGSFKFQNTKAAAENLASLLDARLPVLPASTLLVPIPTTSAHIRQRGYDHLQLISEYFALKRDLPIARVLSRGNTATQHGANRTTRLEQAQSAFRLTGSIDPAATYLILDDVVTTGATIQEASKLLYAAGARTIFVGALARQPLD